MMFANYNPTSGRAVTLEDIKKAALTLNIDTIHFMKGKNNGKVC